MARMDWLRLYTEARTDKKLATLTDAQHRIWFNLLCFAADQQERGTITVDDMDLLALECASGETEHLTIAIDRLCRLRILAVCGSTHEDEPTIITFINFKNRQYDKPSDDPSRVTERVKRHRENVKRDETPCNAVKRDETPETPREEKKREEERREEENCARGLCSPARDFKARYPETSNPTDDDTLDIVWRRCVKGLPGELRVKRELEGWIASGIWDDPRFTPSMETFLTKPKYRTIPPPAKAVAVDTGWDGKTHKIDPEVARQMALKEQYGAK
jgi:hypothetical protein